MTTKTTAPATADLTCPLCSETMERKPRTRKHGHVCCPRCNFTIFHTGVAPATATATI